MHAKLVWLRVVLWATGSHAFFPFLAPASKPKHGDGPTVERRRHVGGSSASTQAPLTLQLIAKTKPRELRSVEISRIARALSRKYGTELPSQTESDDSALGRRDNADHVPGPVDASHRSSAVLDQDGADPSYFVTAELGSKGKRMHMLADTGGTGTWVMGPGCTTEGCSKHNTFGPDDSTTLQDSGKLFDVSYGTGRVQGREVSDSLKVGNFKVTSTFGLANDTSSEFVSFAFDGILGLSIKGSGFMVALKSGKLIDANVFGITMGRSAEGQDNGEISFGAPNPDKYTGEIVYTTTRPDGNWAIPMDSYSIGGKASDVKGLVAWIDTGTTHAFGPPDQVKALYAMIPGASTTDDGISWNFACDAQLPLAFTFSGKTFPIAADDFAVPVGDNVCQGRVFGKAVVSGWLLGDVFLKSVYSVFDTDQTRIGQSFAVMLPYRPNANPSTGFAAKSAGNDSSTAPSADSSKSTSMSMTATSNSQGVVGADGTSATTTASPTAEPSTTPSSPANPPSLACPTVAARKHLTAVCMLAMMALIL